MNRTMQRGLEILKYIGDNPQGVTLQNIVDYFDIPKSSAFVIIQTLLSMNYIMTNPENDKKYHIGIESFSLGMKYATSMDITRETSTLLNPLAEKYGKTAFVGVLDGTSIVYLQKFKSSNAKLASCELGSRKIAHSTALGKVILANLPLEELDKVLSKVNFQKLTEYTISSKEELIEELNTVRKNGYALDIKENYEHMMCYAAPIFDYTKKVIAAISLSDMYKEGEDVEEQIRELKEAAFEISNKLGYR